MNPNPSKACAKHLAACVIFPLVTWDVTAYAQTVPQPPLEKEWRLEAEPQPSSLILNSGPGGPDGPDGGDHFAIGVGGVYQPAYLGSKDYRFQPLPMLDIKWGRFFANFQDGIGATIIDTETVTIGAGITMADNYRAKDAPPGIGKLSFGVGGRGFVTLRKFGFEASAGLSQIITGSTEGMIADFSLSRPIMVSERLFLNPSIGTRWANRKHNNRYFGVSAQQSVASGLPEFRVGSGLLDAKAELGLQYRLTDRIGLGLVGGVSTLLGDVKESPIVEKKTAPYGIGFISYSF